MVDLTMLTIAEAARQIAHKQLSPVELAQAALERITQLNPRLNAFITTLGDRSIAAAKAGVISLTRSAALALAPRGITVNAICPGVVDTPMTRQVHQERAQLENITPAQSLARITSKIPLGRLEMPQDVANVVSFLCSPNASYITGQTLNVDGGMEMD